MSNIYLGTDGNYHDDTDEMRERFPAAEDQPDTGTEAETGTDGGTVETPAIPAEPGSETPPVVSEPAAEPAPETSAKTRKA